MDRRIRQLSDGYFDVCKEIVADRFDYAIAEMQEHFTAKKLRNCNAVVYETENYIILQSYYTKVAVYSKQHKCLYVHSWASVTSRKVTTNQQISKFIKDYCSDMTKRLQDFTDTRGYFCYNYCSYVAIRKMKSGIWEYYM